MGIRIREATSADVNELITLSRKTISDSYSSFLGEKAVAAYIQSGAVDEYVADNIQECAVIEQDGEIVGYSVQKADLIDLMMVDTDYHRRGLGTCLLRHVEDMLFATYDTLMLESFQDNAKANAFYRKCGWSEVRTFSDDESSVEKIEFRKSRSDEPAAVSTH